MRRVARPEANMIVRRHIHHVHSGWPSPYVGVLAVVLFGVAVLGVFSMLLWLARGAGEHPASRGAACYGARVRVGPLDRSALPEAAAVLAQACAFDRAAEVAEEKLFG